MVVQQTGCCTTDTLLDRLVHILPDSDWHLRCILLKDHRSARFFADCTGNGTLCAYAGAQYRIGTESRAEFGEPHAPETATNDRMGNTILFKAVDREHPIDFIPPVDAMHFTEEQLRYRKHCAAIPPEMRETASEEELHRMFDGFCPDYGYWWIEIPGERENIIEEYEDIRDQLVRAVYGVWDHIKNGGDHGAENYELIWVGMLPGTRESRRIECDYMLNENDVLANRRFPDKVAYGGWWIDDNHFGLYAFDHVPSFTIEVQGAYDIPYRSYCVKGFRNLYAGGRCMGATKFGMASTRVMGTCAVGGQAIGTAAALLCKAASADIRAIDITKLQQTLLRDDCYLQEMINLDDADLARRASLSASSEAAGFGAENIINGTTRTLAGKSNQWRPDGNDAEPWLRLDLANTVEVKMVQITFDSNFAVEKKITMSSRRQKQQEPGIPKELVRDFDVILLHGGEEAAVKQIRGNYQRMVRISFGEIQCDAVMLRIFATNGEAAARIFEVRIYDR